MSYHIACTPPSGVRRRHLFNLNGGRHLGSPSGILLLFFLAVVLFKNWGPRWRAGGAHASLRTSLLAEGFVGISHSQHLPRCAIRTLTGQATSTFCGAFHALFNSNTTRT
ncbi:hypothetical protein DFH06DRAFT_1329230 [Mycena polygramma]|nr:hypothetical protein DFH06DRAFT_1329230 [Mycena polygramma]